MCPCFELNLLVCFDMCMCTLLLNLHVHHELFGIAIELSLSSYNTKWTVYTRIFPLQYYLAIACLDVDPPDVHTIII